MAVEPLAVRSFEAEDASQGAHSTEGGLRSQFVVSPIKGRTGWTLLVIGLFLMIIGGNTHFCENFANRRADRPNKVIGAPIIPMWPPTISSMSADILSPAGRFFFVFMLLGGGFVVLSNVLPMSFAEEIHVSPGTIHTVASLMCLGTMLVGTCPTQLMQRSDSVSNAPFLKVQNVSTIVHMAGAACAFIMMPIIELYLVFKRKCGTKQNIATKGRISRFRVAMACSGVLSFVAFQACNLHCAQIYSGYIQSGHCGGYQGNRCRDQHLGWYNALGFWLEYTCASCAIALLASRIFGTKAERILKLASDRKWVVRFDDPLIFGMRDLGVMGALTFQFLSQALSIVLTLYDRPHQSELCCMCDVFGVGCKAVYKNIDNGTKLCTGQIIEW